MPTYLVELSKRGLSLREFARRVDLSPEWVTKIFRGEVEPSAESERKIKDALCACPWCGSKWPDEIPVEGKESTKRQTTSRKA